MRISVEKEGSPGEADKIMVLSKYLIYLETDTCKYLNS